MKRFLFIVASISILILLLFRLRWALTNSTGIGAWSEPVNGLQARLVLAEDPAFNRTRILAVYLELRNVSDSANPLEIFYDEFQLDCRMRTGQSLNPIPESSLPASILGPQPFWLSLPHDSTLRFRISVMGYSIPEAGGTLVGLNCGVWLIDTTKYGDDYFQLTFNSNPPTGYSGRAWQGTLNIPHVKLP